MSQEGDESGNVKKKFRRSPRYTVAYLKGRNDAQFELRKEELDLKKKQHEDMKKQEAATKRQVNLISLMAEQNNA